MAQRVIDQLVPVEVHIQDRCGTSDLDRLVELMGEVHPVGQPGERVMQRGVQEALFGGLALQVERDRAGQGFGQLL